MKHSVPVTKAWIVNMHGEGDEDRHDPGQGDEEVSQAVLPVLILYWFVDSHGPVNADTKYGVDGGIAEESIRGDPGLAQGDAPHPVSGLQDGRGHHEHTQAEVSSGEGEDEPGISKPLSKTKIHQGKSVYLLALQFLLLL